MDQKWQYQFSYADLAQTAGVPVAEARASTERLIALGLIVIVADGGPADDAVHKAILRVPKLDDHEREEQP